MTKKRTRSTRKRVAEGVKVFDQMIAREITLTAAPADLKRPRLDLEYRTYPNNDYGLLTLRATNERPAESIVIQIEEIEAFAAGVTEIARLAKEGALG